MLNYTVRQMHRQMLKSDLISGLISGSHIRPGPDMAAGYENLARCRSGSDIISGATPVNTCAFILFTDVTSGKRRHVMYTERRCLGIDLYFAANW